MNTDDDGELTVVIVDEEDLLRHFCPKSRHYARPIASDEPLIPTARRFLHHSVSYI